MKYYLISIISLVIITGALYLYVNFGSNKPLTVSGIKQPVKSTGKTGLCCLEDLKPAEYSENSIYLLKSVWKNQDNKKVILSDLSGKQVVLAMVYTNCPTACPVIVNNMQKIEALIPKNKIDNYSFVLVSIDPKRDTPEQLKKFSEEKNLNAGRWTLLTGSTTDVAELAQAIGFRYKESQPGLFVHSNLITFLNTSGVIINQSEGLNITKNEILTSLNN
jgi:protein SCO1/2